MLEFFAKRNGTRMPDRPLADVGGASASASGSGSGNAGSKRLTLLDALKDWHIARRSLVLGYSWMVICMTYCECAGRQLGALQGCQAAGAKGGVPC